MKNFALLDVFYQTKKSGMVKNLAYFRLKILCSTFYLIRLGLVCEFCNFLHVGCVLSSPASCQFGRSGARRKDSFEKKSAKILKIETLTIFAY